MGLLRRLLGRFPALVIARRNVGRARTRSALAAISITIGVIAIGAIGGGGAAFKTGQLQTIQDQGATNVFVSPGFDHDGNTFDNEDVTAIDEAVGGAGVVATRSIGMDRVTPRGEREGVSATYIDGIERLYTVQSGTIPPDWRQGVVLGGEFAAEHGYAPGDRIRLVQRTETPEGVVETERTYQVTAVLAPSQSFTASSVYLPIRTADERQYSQLTVTTESVDEAERAAQRLRNQFNDRKDRLLVFELTGIVRLLTTIINGINAFLAGLGAISLLVAAVSITNTMLMAVIKRREEIGVLRAVGYSREDVVRILLAEAALLGVIGAVIGLVVATLITMAANAVFLGDPMAFTGSSLGYLLAAVGFGVVTSLLAGVYPAWRAANERPVEALRG